MNLSITGHHLIVTPAIRAYIENKIERVLRHFDHVIDANVILSVEKLRQRAEISLHVRGKDLFVECADEDLYAAIDSAMDKMDRQVLKYKARAYAHPHDPIKHHSPEAEL
jgi:putative sigma-54 modulation protein